MTSPRHRMPAPAPRLARVDLRDRARGPISWARPTRAPELHAYEIHMYVFDLDSAQGNGRAAERVLSTEELSRAEAFRDRRIRGVVLQG